MESGDWPESLLELTVLRTLLSWYDCRTLQTD